MDAEESNRTSTEDYISDSSVSVSGKRECLPVNAAGNLNGSHQSRDKRYRVDAFRLASDSDNKVVREPARKRNPEWESRADATQSSVVERVDAAISL